MSQGVGAVGELLIKSVFVATSWDGFGWEIGNLFWVKGWQNSVHVVVECPPISQ